MAQPETQELPAELAERLQRLADTQTAGSHPWPGVDRAIRTTHRRRLAGLSAVTVVGVLLAGVAYTDLATPNTRPAPAARPDQPMLREGLAQLRAAGYGGPTAGSLAGDSEWLAQARERARTLIAELPREPGSGRAVLASADDVLMPWAGELSGTRYALIAYPTGKVINGTGRPGPSFSAAVLTGDRADRLTILRVVPWSEQNPDQIETAVKFLLPKADPADDDPSIALVAGPGVTGVKVATARSFTAEGKLRTTWRSLQNEGVAWVGELTEAETYMSDLRLEGNQGAVSVGDSAGPLIARLRAIAPAGTNQEALDCAIRGTSGLGTSIGDQPMLARTAPAKARKTNLIAAAAFRAPDGTWLLNFCRGIEKGGRMTALGSGGGVIIPDGGDPGTFMAAMQDFNSADAEHGVGYLLVAPTGATTATLGDQTVEVHNRLAIFPRDDDGKPGATIRALDRSGKVLGTVRSLVQAIPEP